MPEFTIQLDPSLYTHVIPTPGGCRLVHMQPCENTGRLCVTSNPVPYDSPRLPVFFLNNWQHLRPIAEKDAPLGDLNDDGTFTIHPSN